MTKHDLVWVEGTASSKKKKAKLQRVMATVKKASRGGQQDQAQSFAAIQLLHNPQVPAPAAHL